MCGVSAVSFQNHISTSEGGRYECLLGLIEAQRGARPVAVRQLRDLIYGVFGGDATYFMMPTLQGLAHPEMMTKEWIGERVSVVDIARVLGTGCRPRQRGGPNPVQFRVRRTGGLSAYAL